MQWSACRICKKIQQRARGQRHREYRHRVILNTVLFTTHAHVFFFFLPWIAVALRVSRLGINSASLSHRACPVQTQCISPRGAAAQWRLCAARTRVQLAASLVFNANPEHALLQEVARIGFVGLRVSSVILLHNIGAVVEFVMKYYVTKQIQRII